MIRCISAKVLSAAAVLAMLALLPARAFPAPAWQPHSEILQTARERLEKVAATLEASRVAVRIGRLDPRVRLQRCTRKLTAELPEGARERGNTTVLVHCPDPGGWSIYVSGKIEVFDKVVVLERSLGRGETVTREMLSVRERNTAQLRFGYFRRPEEVVGRVARRTLPAGTVPTPDTLAPPLLVRRGERVTLLATRGAVSVRMQGEALKDGARGDRIRVRNLRSKRVVEGEVVERGVVKMTL